MASREFLVRGGWDSKRLVDDETRKGLFGFLDVTDSEGLPADPNDLVGRTFLVIGADDKRMYLEETTTRRKR